MRTRGKGVLEKALLAALSECAREFKCIRLWVKDASEPPDALQRAALAYENSQFLESPDGRLLRILSEYQEPMARFRRERVQDTVVFFGSARFGSAEGAQSGSRAAGDAGPAESAVAMAAYYEDARRLAYLLTDWAKALPGRSRVRRPKCRR